ncbi:MAG: response regulator, partial [Chloroflexota bacterium]
MLKGLRLLCIDSERGVSELIREALEYNRATIDWAGTAKGGLKAARVTSYDVILLEHDLPDIDGISVLETLRTENIQTPVIMLSAFGSQEVATRAIKSGASDFIMKDINLGFLDVLPPLILKTVEYHQTENEREAAKEALAYERMRSTV